MMMRRLGSYTLAIALLACLRQPASAAEATLVSVSTARGAKQSYLLITPEKPVATVVLFAGGHGALGLRSATRMNWGAANFLVRSRDLFAKHGFMVAVMDAPSDHAQGMNAEFRMSAAHAGDIAAVVADLKKRAPLPVWLVGTSMGTFSAARGAIAPSSADGLVLTSTITRAKAQWKIAQSHAHGVASMPLAKVSLPTLVLSHAMDACDITPAGDAVKLQRALSKAKAVEVIKLSGGSPPQSEPCEARSQHGYLGIENKAVDAIAAFIAKQSAR